MSKKDTVITDKEKEIELIWEDLSANTKAIKVIENNILSNIESLDRNKNPTFENINDMEVKMKNMEKRMDDKLLVFSEELEKKFEKKISSIIQKFENEIKIMKETIGKFRTEIHTKLNDLNKWKAESLDEINNMEKFRVLPQEWTNVNDLAEKIKIHHRDITKLMETNEGIFERLGFTSEKKEHQNQVPLNHARENRPNYSADRNNPVDQNRIPDNTHNRYIVDNQNHNKPSPTQQTQQTQHNVELLICIDSNRRYIDWRKFWTLKGTEKRFCGNLAELERYIRSENKIGTLKNILINIGVNDLGNVQKQNLCVLADFVR